MLFFNLLKWNSSNWHITPFNHWKEKTNWRAIFYSFIMFVEWVIFLAFVFMVIRLATSKLEYNWETTSCSKSILLVEINELNITDLLLWIIVQRLKLINVEHIVFECMARDGHVDVSNRCWWQKLSVTIITLVTRVWSHWIWDLGLFGVFLLHFFYFGDDLVRLAAGRFLQVLIFNSNHVISYELHGMLQLIW